MSEKPINVGDLVYVAKPKPCCGNTAALGRVFRVAQIDNKPGHCHYCKSIRYTPRVVTTCGIPGELSVLRRLDAPMQDETVTERDEVSA